jgi:hypothetical protein
MSKQRLIWIVLAGLVLAEASPASGTPIRVSSEASTDPQEVVIAINPANPDNIVIGANIEYFYYSCDGGGTWTQGELTSPYGVWGDPSVAFDLQGNAYYAHLSRPGEAGYWLDRIVVQKSDDGGTTWSDGVGVGHNPPKQQDKEWIVVDQSASPHQGNVYVAWTEFDSLGSFAPTDSSRIVLARSTDQAATWSDPVRVSDRAGTARDDDSTVEGVVPAIGPEGQIYLSWAVDERIYFDRSLDGGATFGDDVVVARQPGGWVIGVPGMYRCNGWPVTACDVSNSPYRGHVYVSWADQRNGPDDTDVFLMKSTDGGQTWHSRVRVNDDVGSAHQFFQWMAVDPVTGHISIVFYDRRATTGNATDVYVATSRDGGATFENIRVSNSSFTPDASVFFGDYNGIAARNGRIYPVWARMDGTERSVWTTVLNERPTNSGSALVSLGPVGPHPFYGSGVIALELSRATDLDLAIYDARGRRVTTLARGRWPATEHLFDWDGKDLAGWKVAAGIYYCRASAGGTTAARKIMLLR